MRKLLIPALMLSTIAAVAPAAAQYGGPPRGGPGVERQLAQQIRQLDQRIDRAAQRRAISHREAVHLRRDANQLDRLFDRYRRNGIDQREYRDLQVGISRIENRLWHDRRDGRRR